MIRRRFKHFMPERVELSVSGDEQLLSVSEYYGVKPRSEAFDDDASEARASSLEGYRVVRSGDFVMNYMLAWKGAYGVSNYDGIVSPAYAVYKIDERVADRRYIHHRLRSDIMRSEFRARSKGIIESRLRLYPDAFLAMGIELPDVETQRTVANFLDRETARIDQLIEKKQRLVELLKEKHDAQITSEVTGTVSGASSRKISRSPFIQTIPEGWEDAEIKHLVQPGTSITYGIVQAGPEFEGGIPYIRTGDMKGDDLPISGYPLTSPEIEQSYARSRMERGDLVIAIRATVGKCLRLPDELIGANLTQGTAKISPGPRIDREFMFFAIRSMPSQAFFEESSKGATFKEITLDRLRRLVLPLPPRDAQRAIVQRLLKAEDIFRRVKWATIESGERLREFRSALITAAVTGQIDIGAWGRHGNTDRRLEQIEEEMRT